MHVKTGKLEDVCGGSALHIGEWIALSRLYAETEAWSWPLETRHAEIKARIIQELEERGVDPNRFHVIVNPTQVRSGPLPRDWFPRTWLMELRLINEEPE